MLTSQRNPPSVPVYDKPLGVVERYTRSTSIKYDVANKKGRSRGDFTFGCLEGHKRKMVDKKRVIIAIAICLGVQVVKAQSIEYARGEYTISDTTLPYRIAETGSGDIVGMAVFLHGGSACGEDNEAQLAAFLATNIETQIMSTGRQWSVSSNSRITAEGGGYGLWFMVYCLGRF